MLLQKFNPYIHIRLVTDVMLRKGSPFLFEEKNNSNKTQIDETTLFQKEEVLHKEQAKLPMRLPKVETSCNHAKNCVVVTTVASVAVVNGVVGAIILLC